MEDELHELEDDFRNDRSDSCGNRRQVILHFDIGNNCDLPVSLIQWYRSPYIAPLLVLYCVDLLSNFAFGRGEGWLWVNILAVKWKYPKKSKTWYPDIRIVEILGTTLEIIDAKFL